MYVMEEFIEAIKEHQCLWNPLDKEYRNGDVKDSAWQSIVDLNLHIRGLDDIKSAKNEWKKLRDNHRDSLKRQKNKTTPNTWRYARTMEFLVPFMKTRESGATEQYPHEIEYDGKHSPAAVYLHTTNVKKEEEEEEEEEDEEEEDSKATGQHEKSDIARKRRADTDFSVFIKEIEKVCQKRGKQPIEYFFESMAQTTKSLPVYLQNRIKKGVLDIVCQAEEEMESYRVASGN